MRTGSRGRWVAVGVVALGALGAAVAAFLARRGEGLAERLLRYAPADAKVVAFLDAGRLRGSGLYQRMREKLSPAEEQLMQDLRGLRLGLDDVEGALVAGSHESGVVLIATGRAMALEDVLKAPERSRREEVEGYAVAATPGPGGQWVARLGDRLFCLSERAEALRGVLGRARAGEGPALNGEVDELLRPLRRYEHFIGVGGLAGSLGKAEWLLPAPVVAELAAARAVGVGLSVGGGVDIEVRGRFAHEDKAMRLCGEVRKVLREGIAKLESQKPGLEGDKLASAERALVLLKGIDVSQAGTLVCLRARLDEETTGSLVEPLVAGVTRARERALLAANMERLRQLGLACIAYETAKGVWPRNLAALAESGHLSDKEALVSPFDSDPPVGAGGLRSSYGSSLDRLGGRSGPMVHLPLAWDRVEFVPGKRCVLFFDGHVEAVGEVRFGALMRFVELAAAVSLRLPVAPKKTTRADSELIGGPRGLSFRLVSPTGGPLLGIRCTVRTWLREECIGTVEPLFGPAPAGPTTALAKPGYAVGAVEVDAASVVNAIRVVFMRIEEGGLRPGDCYRSEWLGRPTGRPTRLLDGKGARVVGLCGRRGMAVNALGLVAEADSGP